MNSDLGSDAVSKEHRCKFCSKEFILRKNKRQHEKNDCVKNPLRNMISCVRCSKSFTRRESLKRHGRTCSAKPAYKLEDNDESTSLRKSDLHYDNNFLGSSDLDKELKLKEVDDLRKNEDNGRILNVKSENIFQPNSSRSFLLCKNDGLLKRKHEDDEDTSTSSTSNYYGKLGEDDSFYGDCYSDSEAVDKDIDYDEAPKAAKIEECGGVLRPKRWKRRDILNKSDQACDDHRLKHESYPEVGGKTEDTRDHNNYKGARKMVVEENDYTSWKDPNILVDRLRLLHGSLCAGNYSCIKEISFILKELRNAGYIQ